MSLSPSQYAAADAFQDFLLDPDENEFVISGFAGSGKSYLVSHLVDLAYNQFQLLKAFTNEGALNLYFTATTNKAAAVLAEMLGTDTSTIHSLLQLRVMNDYKTGRQVLKRSDRATVIKNALIFIDEASMINKELLQRIREYTYKCKVVYIGDPYQLTPVRENDSPVFTAVKNHYHLTEIQRQAAQNPVIHLSGEYRAILDKTAKSWPELVPDNQHIFRVDGPEMKRLIDEKFSFPHGPDDYRVLAWSNDKVIQYNKYIRSLYTQETFYEDGEYVITNKPIVGPAQEVLAMTDAVLQIHTVNEEDEMYGIKGRWITLSRGMTIFQPYSWQEAQSLQKHYAKHKDWQNYFAVKEQMADLRPAHALTCHKAQGSTYKEVFIDLDDIGRNTKWYEVARLLYVAITRASEKVYLYGNLPPRYQGDIS